ncbi:unnamed protein product [Moneuplotes crassus]|uniref:Uncharacterized protein n=1 Tax=Euplotes crassus TaxID=5936 RepID=A0AAD1Y1X4_EUPCR|nr:unnamed protein product [Moneuplotes crassus]
MFKRKEVKGSRSKKYNKETKEFLDRKNKYIDSCQIFSYPKSRGKGDDGKKFGQKLELKHKNISPSIVKGKLIAERKQKQIEDRNLIKLNVQK